MPMTLLLVRHGERVPADGAGDHAAPLKPSGRAQAAALAGALACAGLGADLFVTSRYAHAIETADILAAEQARREGGDTARVVAVPAFTPHSPTETLEQILADVRGQAQDPARVSRLAFVGHEPRLSQLFQRLTGRDTDRLGYATAAWLRADNLDDCLLGKATPGGRVEPGRDVGHPEPRVATAPPPTAPGRGGTGMEGATSLAMFDELIASFDRVEAALLGPAPAAPNVRYLATLARVCEILSQIHDGVIDVTVEIAVSDDLAGARAKLELLNQHSLKQTLHAQQLCDELGRLGSELTPILRAEAALPAQDLAAWTALAQQLEGHEEEVAQLYDESLYDLRLLPETVGSLSELQAKVNAVAETLALQKAQFDLLAKRVKAFETKLAVRR